MAKQASAKGRKIGRFARKPTNQRYKASNKRDENKRRKIERYARTFGIIPLDDDAEKHFPGWKYTEGYGFNRV